MNQHPVAPHRPARRAATRVPRLLLPIPLAVITLALCSAAGPASAQTSVDPQTTSCVIPPGGMSCTFSLPGPPFTRANELEPDVITYRIKTAKKRDLNCTDSWCYPDVYNGGTVQARWVGGSGINMCFSNSTPQRVTFLNAGEIKVDSISSPHQLRIDGRVGDCTSLVGSLQLDSPYPYGNTRLYISLRLRS